MTHLERILGTPAGRFAKRALGMGAFAFIFSVALSYASTWYDDSNSLDLRQLEKDYAEIAEKSAIDAGLNALFKPGRKLYYLTHDMEK